MSNENIKELLGEDTISEETLTKLSEMIDSHTAAQVQLKEETLTKEFADKEQALKEASDKEKSELECKVKELEDKVEELEDDKKTIQEKADLYVAQVKEEVDSRINESVETAVSEFLKENEEKLQKLEKFEKMQSVFESIKTSFEENGFQLNENLELDTKTEELKDLTEAYDSLKTEFDAIETKLQESTKENIIVSLTKDIADTQKEKVKSLTESIAFTNEEEFKNAVSLIVENLVSDENKEKQEKLIEKKTDDTMDKILKYLVK